MITDSGTDESFSKCELSLSCSGEEDHDDFAQHVEGVPGTLAPEQRRPSAPGSSYLIWLRRLNLKRCQDLGVTRARACGGVL